MTVIAAGGMEDGMTDERLEEIIESLVWIADMMKAMRGIALMDNCNTCGVTKCKFRPEWGRPVRYNCPLYAEGDNGAKEDDGR